MQGSLKTFLWSLCVPFPNSGPPSTRAGFGFGGMRGRGVLSARSGDGWSAPAFLTLTGGSFGLQIGVQRSDIVLVIMVPEGLDNLVSNQFSIGVDAGLARWAATPRRRPTSS